MEWDKFKMAWTFLQKANAIRPEDGENSAVRDHALALQDLYYECYMSSFSREELMKRLRAVIGGALEMPEAEVDQNLYRDVYMKEAQNILSSVQRGDYG